ncbi:hypothetical protein WR25_23618 [Diploscapter pachys]|uniref:G-protein coupled receptors family 1 profile domain-containing protein n=1 Tax=Diploscapter pachys TaxID=2018661 RepID=A0A2A2J788_9BILA|nr:hypothetical protein WR25_23618 [Diploscapter pachys]
MAANNMLNYSLVPVENEEFEGPGPCEWIPLPLVGTRLIIVGFFGTTVAVISIIENLVFSIILFKKRSYRSSHTLYIGLIAFFDFLIAMAYIPLMSLSIFVDYTQNATLLKAWYTYMYPTIMISHLAMTASSFLMVVASWERYRITRDPMATKWLNKNRVKIALSAIISGFITKISHPMEIKISHDPSCAGTVMEWNIEPSALATDPIYIYWKVWIRSFITILIPFALLTIINLLIVLKVRENEFQFLSAQKISEMRKKSRTRAAAKTMIFVVLTYLLSNILNVIMILWEYADSKYLEKELLEFYMVAVDLVSLSTIVAGAARPLIYVWCQSEFRTEITNNLKSMFMRPQRRGYSGASVIATEDSSCGDFEDQPEKQSKPVTDLFMKLGTVLLVEKKKDKDPNHIIRNGEIIV